MGSSKKHKEKDKDRDRDSRKRHHRSRSRSKERHSHRDRKEKRDRSRSRSKERDRKRTRESSEENNHRAQIEKLRIKDERAAAIDSDVEIRSSSNGNDVSLSIEETNKLRIKLGLKPLDVGNDNSGNSEKDDGKKDFVHKPAENLRDKIHVEKLREKIALQKERRKVQEKLSKIKGLGDSDSDVDDTAGWIKKSRYLQGEKEKAEKRAKLLEEMDEEFGIGSLIEDEFKVAKSYSSKDLTGFTIEHAQDRFKDEREIVLTIKDKAVLDEKDDVLINVNFVDDEKAEKNTEIRKKKPGYEAFEEADEMALLGKTSILKKYDEEIDGEKRKSFIIGLGGEVDVSQEKELLEIRRKLMHKNAESLNTQSLTIASEYLTSDEMVSFKKPKKKVRKIPKRRNLTADDLARVVTEHDMIKDYGSRHRSKVAVKEEFPDNTDDSNSRNEWENQVEDMELDKPNWDETEILGPDEDLSNVVIEPDEAELELQLALNKTRKLRQREEMMTKNFGAHEKMESQDSSPDKDGTLGPKGSIVMNSTAEFCRALGDIPTYGLSGNRDEDVDDLLDFERDLVEERKRLDDDANKQNVGAWNEVGIDEKPVEIKKEDAPILEEEPDVSSGLAGALKLAMKKGYLEKETKKVVSAPRHSQLQAANYTIEDKSFFDDDKYGRRDRYCAGPVTDFREKDTYKPDVKLEYIDDSGRLLTPKEAFRYLSHKFHGKGSGKNKTEKRMKKLQEEALMKQMSSTDTPLGTLALLQEKQKQTQSPFILLSGGSKALNPNAISKPT